MSRPRKPLDETIRGEIYFELCRYATTHQVIPSAHSFWRNIMKPGGYNVTWSTFRDHWRDLMLDGLLSVDPGTGALRITRLQILEKDNQSGLTP